MINLAKRHTYWLHFIERWAVWGEGGGHGITGPRLRKLYDSIMCNDSFWEDVILRHGNYTQPMLMRDGDPAVYDHCAGNFWGMIHQMMIDRQMLG